MCKVSKKHAAGVSQQPQLEEEHLFRSRSRDTSSCDKIQGEIREARNLGKRRK